MSEVNDQSVCDQIDSDKIVTELFGFHCSFCSFTGLESITNKLSAFYINSYPIV